MDDAYSLLWYLHYGLYDGLYEYTVAAAIEGATLNIPSIAISVDSFKPGDFSTSKIVVHKVINFIKIKEEMQIKNSQL